MSGVERTVCSSAPWRTFAGRVVLPWVLDGVTPAGNVLEIGGGTGAVADAVLRGNPDVRYTVTDLDPLMVTKAAGRLAKHADRVRVEEADATAVPSADGSFDLVLSFVMLHHVTAWPAVLAEAARVLRPGGRLIGLDLTRTRITGGFHRSRTAHIAMVTPTELTDGLIAAGFAQPVVRPSLFRSVVRFRAVASA